MVGEDYILSNPLNIDFSTRLMQKLCSVFIFRLVSTAYICLFLLSVTSPAQNSRKFTDNDALVYAQTFHRIAGLDQEAEKLDNQLDRDFVRNYIANRAGLDENNVQILKAIASNYASVFNLLSYKDKLKTALIYRDALRKEIGSVAFAKFDHFVRAEPGMAFPPASDPDGYGGHSSIMLNEMTHTLIGISETIAYSRPAKMSANEMLVTCSVNATMSGPGVKVSDSASNSCSTHPRVTLTATTYVANSQYCVYGTHGNRSGSVTTSQSCLTTPNTPRVTNVEYVPIVANQTLIDDNPNTGLGRRIYPDDNIPDDPVDRRKIRVNAHYYQPTPGIRIYFRNFDVDDPSADGAPIDTNDSTSVKMGNDNNGNVDGTTATRAGVLSVPVASPANPYDCQPFTNGTVSGLSCLTDANGVAKVDFTVTMQPGDNFAVVASAGQAYIESLSPTDDGVNLKDANNIQTPVALTTSNSCLNTSIKACRADMLTVWRRLHVEKDSMGFVILNKVDGTFSASKKVIIGTNTLMLNASLEPNRFENGRIKIGDNLYPIIDSNPAANPPIYANTANTVTIINRRGSFQIFANDPFTLYDDDDFNSNDGTVLDGDTLPAPGEDVVENTDILSWFQASSNPLENLFAIAYIIPDYTWAEQNQLNNANATFQSNVVDDGVDVVIDEKRNSGNLESDRFWIAYLLFSYQGATSEDFDPVSESATGGIARSASLTDGPLAGGPVTVPFGSDGALIYLETGRDYDSLLFDEDIPVRKTIVPHEIGHQFGLKGDDVNEIFGIMNSYAYDGTSFNPVFVPRHINVLRRRVSSPGK